MRNILKLLISLPLILSLAYLVYLNVALHRQPSIIKVGSQPLNADLLAQMRHLKLQLHAGAADDMQGLYPEGFVFLNALYSLGWSEVAATAPSASALHREAIAESRWAVQEIASTRGKAIFTEDLPLAYGAFYNGWLNYSLGKLLLAQPPAQRPARDLALFRTTCQRIAESIADTLSPYPESYSGAAWPADATLCVASLALHDQLTTPQYQPLLRSWIRRVAARTDSLGLIPHAAEPGTGRAREGARGSSQSLMLSMLYEIDPAFGRQQFSRFQRYFADERLGLPGIREYPKGWNGTGDIDSGPVIWDIGGAASIVGRRAMQQYGQATQAVGLRNSIEAFGMALQINGQKRYLFGALPIADAFIAWSNAWDSTHPPPDATGWQWAFHLRSVGIALLLLAALAWLWRRHLPKRSPQARPLINA